jgi:hypothetical protein
VRGFFWWYTPEYINQALKAPDLNNISIAAIRRFPMETKKSSWSRLKMVFHPPVVETWVLAPAAKGTT